MKNKIFKNKKFIFASLGLVFLILIGGAVFFYNLKQNIIGNSEILLIQSNDAKDCLFKNQLNGVCLLGEQKNQWPVAIMIDNHPDAWPQFGLGKASLVYSTLVEGGATRLMAVFSNTEALKIGPVRSARPYFLTWAKEINALYGHSGGSFEALDKIKKYEIINLEEATSYGPLYFYRDKSKAAPHNLFTSAKNLSLALNDFNLASSTSSFVNWKFSVDANMTVQSAQNISIDYSGMDLFDVAYSYNTTTDLYLRFQNNKPHLDGLNDKQIAVQTVIIQFVPEEIHLDAADRLQIDTLGEGRALIFYHGKQLIAHWSKKMVTDRTIFYTENNEEVIFPPGNVWVEVVPGKRDVLVD